MNIANKITLSRALSAPFFVLLYALPLYTKRGIVFSAFTMLPFLAFFELTDFFDGYMARRLKEVSDVGKIGDPAADVILNLNVFASSFMSIRGEPYVSVIFFALILTRELSMTSLRTLAALKGVAIGAKAGGKLKTVFYIITIFFIVAVESAARLSVELDPLFISRVLTILLSLCVLFSYASFIDYLVHFVKKSGREK